MLEAIFTGSSPLHDGAVVIAADRLARAGVVLPLATGTADPSFGTRHRAAIGLAQASDALIVCVSEERGTVHLAVGNAMNLMRDQAQLRDALAMSRPQAPSALPRREAQHRASLASQWPHLVIFGGVLAAWAALALDRSHAITRVVPLEIRGVSDGLVFDPPRYTSVAVELRSSRRELEVLPPDSVGAFVDLSGTSVGTHTYRIVTTAPAGIEVVSETPSSMEMEIRSRVPTNPSSAARATASAREAQPKPESPRAADRPSASDPSALGFGAGPPGRAPEATRSSTLAASAVHPVW